MLRLAAHGHKISLGEEREVQVQASIAMHWRLAGFHVELDSYGSGPAVRRPDFGVWLPYTRQYLFLEFKEIWPGGGCQSALKDLGKLNEMFETGDRNVGLLTVGFASSSTNELKFQQQHEAMSGKIQESGLYGKVGLKKIPIIDDGFPIVCVGMWVRGLSNDQIGSPL